MLIENGFVFSDIIRVHLVFTDENKSKLEITKKVHSRKQAWIATITLKIKNKRVKIKKEREIVSLWSNPKWQQKVQHNFIEYNLMGLKICIYSRCV